MDARRGTVSNIQVVDDRAMSISGCKVVHDAANTLSVTIGVLFISGCKVQHDAANILSVMIGVCRLADAMHGTLTGVLSITGCKARHDASFGLGMGIRSSSFSPLLLLLSVVNANWHVLSSFVAWSDPCSTCVKWVSDVNAHSLPHCSRASGLLCPRVLMAEEMAP